MIGLRRVRETASDVSAKMLAAAENTKAAVVTLALVAVTALLVACAALLSARKARMA